MLRSKAIGWVCLGALVSALGLGCTRPQTERPQSRPVEPAQEPTAETEPDPQETSPQNPAPKNPAPKKPSPKKPSPKKPSPESIARACTWLRHFAPRQYSEKTDAELAKLEEITLYSVPTESDLPQLRGFPALRRLKIWDKGGFGRKPTHPVGVLDNEILRGISGLTRLESLVIGGWNVKYTDEGLRHLLKLGSLEKLNLCQAQGITDAGMKTLTASRLRSLDITYTKITDVGLEHLLGVSTLREVKYGWAAESRRWLERFKAKHPDRAFLK